MSVVINSITIKVHARAFHASFELWQLQGNSLNPKWQKSDLRYTRITDPKRGEVGQPSPIAGYIAADRPAVTSPPGALPQRPPDSVK